MYKTTNITSISSKSGFVSPPLEEENKVFILEPIDYFDSEDKSCETCFVSPLTLILDIIDHDTIDELPIVLSPHP